MPYPLGVPKWRRFLRFWRPDVAADVDDELRFHFEQRAEELRARGVADADVERTVLAEFGDVDATRRRLREIGERLERRRERRRWWHQLVADLRYALRGVRRTPGFALAVVATIALGIGANAAIFSTVDRLLFRAPPLLDAPGRTHRVYVAYPLPDGSGERFVLDVVPYARYRELGAWTTALERTALHMAFPMAVGTGAETRELPVAAVSASFFGFFDAPPALGRYFGDAEDLPPAGAPVAVLSHAAWRSRFGGRRDVLGATLQIGPTVYAVIGVAPANFVGLWPEQPPVAFIPVASFAAAASEGRPHEDAWWTSYTNHVAAMLVRRKPESSLAAVHSDLGAALQRSWEAEGGPPGLQPQAVAASVLGERGPQQTSAARVAALVGAMALVVLLIACANVANLLLARALRRQREIAVRLSLGVSRGRLLSHLLVESVLLASAGGVAGLLVAQWGGAALRTAFLPPGAPSPVLGDVRTLVFVAVAVLVVGVLTGLAPAWQARRIELSRDLRLGVREGTPHSARTRTLLLVAQGALSVLLLVGAGLFVRSLQNVRQARLGFDVAPLLTADVRLRGVRLDSARGAALRERLLAAARAVPGVERAALAAHVPLSGTTFLGAVRVPGIDPARMRRMPNFHRNVVSPEYFATMGTRIVRGRGFGPADVAGAPGAVVVSGAMARMLWPGRDALGQCVMFGREATTPCSIVVGIAEDVRHATLSGGPAPLYYLSTRQTTDRGAGLLVRTRGDGWAHVEAVRQALQRELPGESYVTVAPLADVVGEQTRSWRLGATMFVVFGALALTLAAVGLYGVVAYEVTQRSHEMGVRLALGACAADVLWLGVRRGVLLAGVGVVLGIALALAAAGRVAPLLFDVSPRDPLVYAGVAVAMLVVGTAASAIPARRASRMDPTITLRSE